MKPSPFLLALAFTAPSASSPTMAPPFSSSAAALAAAPERRQLKALCDQYAYWSGNGYEVLNNLWGRDAASSGSQCTYVDGASGGVQWHSTWTWVGAPNNVKSYVYAGRQVAKGRTIASIGSMQTTAVWKYDNYNVRANVAYDIFTAADPNHVNSSGDFEVMIWYVVLLTSTPLTDLDEPGSRGSMMSTLSANPQPP
jgi:xyloglucan-specific endo-beta-1,4-glucanase